MAAPQIETEFALTPIRMGILFSAFFWTYELLQLFVLAGWIADRFSVGLVLGVGLCLWSLATVATGLVSSFAALFALRLMVGAGESVAYPCYSRILATEIPAEGGGLANALLDAGSKLGPAFGVFAGGILLPITGWRLFFIVLGGISLLWLWPWTRYMPRSRASIGDASASGPATLEILACRRAWGAFLGHFCGNYCWFFLLTWLPDYFVKQRHFSMQGMATIGSVAFLTIAGATGTASIVLLPLACIGFGAFTINHWAITQTLAGSLAAGRWTSLRNGIGNLSGIAASWLTGAVVERTHSFPLAFVAAAGFALLGAVLWGAATNPVAMVEWERAS